MTVRRTLPALVAGLVVLAAPGIALGAEARVEQQGPDRVLVYDGGLERQDGTISFDPAFGAFRVHDPNGINPGPGCANFNPDTVTCDDAGMDRIEADLGAAVDGLVVAANITLPVVADGGGGDDSLIGGSGDDDLQGNADADSVKGGSGNDEAAGGLGDDVVDGGTGDDTVFGFVPGFDSLHQEDDDQVHGGSGDDLIDPAGGGGRDTIAGEEGDDLLNASSETASLTGGTGTDAAVAAVDPDTGAGSTVSLDGVADDGVPGQDANFAADIENLLGSEGDDTLIGDPNVANRLAGQQGDDSLIDDRGASLIADTLDGGTGLDTADYGARTADVAIDTASPGGDGETGEGDIVATESLIGGSGDDRLLSPGPTARTLAGGDGADFLEGGTAADTIDGGLGSDTVTYADRSVGVEVVLDTPIIEGEDRLPHVENAIGGSGDDRIRDESQGSANEIDGGAGDDVIDASRGSDDIAGGPGADVLDGGPDVFGGSDTVDYDDHSVPVTVALPDSGTAAAGPAGELDQITDFEHATGGTGDDVLRGNLEPNTLRGGPGNDGLDGGGGIASDLLDGGTGADLADYADRTSTLVIDLQSGRAGEKGSTEEDELQLVENATGGAADDLLAAAFGAANELAGGPGDDLLRAGAGSEPDVLRGDAGGDTASYDDRVRPLTLRLGRSGVSGVAGEGDTLLVEEVIGGEASDALFGDRHENRLRGGPGDDRLSGGGGTEPDSLDGGLGVDLANYASRGSTPVRVRLAAGVGGVAGEGDSLTGIESARGAAGDDVLRGDGANNSLLGRRGDDVLDGGGAGDDLLHGAGGVDLADYGARSEPLTLSLAGAGPDGAAGEADRLRRIEDLAGGSGADELTGDGAANSLAGGDGADALDAGAGEDALLGGLGPDSIRSRDGVQDQVSCGTGPDPTAIVDSLDLVDSDCDTVDDGSAGRSCAGSEATIVGTRGDDELTGTVGPDVIAALAGNDEIRSRRGNDLVCAGPGNDLTLGGPGADELYGGPGDDRLNGGTEEDTCRGGAGVDRAPRCEL